LNLAESVGYAMEFDFAVKSLRPFGKNAAALTNAIDNSLVDSARSRGASDEKIGDKGLTEGQGYLREMLMKKRIKVLKTMLKDDHHHVCGECSEKMDFVNAIMQFAMATDAVKDEL
jgi:hypothetical protein